MSAYVRQPGDPADPDQLRELLKDIEDTFADPEAWLNMPNLRLAGQKPIDLIGTPDEKLVRYIIDSIKYGLFS